MSKQQNLKSALIVDDNKMNTLVLEGMLQPFDLEINITYSGLEAVKILQENSSIGIIFLDLYLPDKDGFETITLIRKLQAYKTTPIIAVSGRVEKNIRERCLTASFNEYLSKPIDYDIFSNLLESLLN